MLELFADATAIVRVIGLVTMMQNGKSVDAVMPRVVGMHSTSNDTAIHDHSAVLAVPADAVEGDTTGWKLKPLVGGYVYVLLDGDHLRIEPKARNPRATIPSALPHITNNCRRLEGTVLLSADYTPPDYLGAAAVLRLPFGKVTACQAVVNCSPTTRVDTQVELRNKGTIDVIATKGNLERKLTLKGSAMILFANLPNWFLQNPSITPTASDAGHFEAYLHMLDEKVRNRCGLGGAVGYAPPCELSSIIRVGSTDVPAYTIPIELMHITYQCSNSQYP